MEIEILEKLNLISQELNFLCVCCVGFMLFIAFKIVGNILNFFFGK